MILGAARPAHPIPAEPIAELGGKPLDNCFKDGAQKRGTHNEGRIWRRQRFVVSVGRPKAYKMTMPKNRFLCANHFRNVVTTSAGNPTCRECGLSPTEAEAESIQTLIDWDKARLRANVVSARKFSTRRAQ